MTFSPSPLSLKTDYIVLLLIPICSFMYNVKINVDENEVSNFAKKTYTYLNIQLKTSTGLE